MYAYYVLKPDGTTAALYVGGFDSSLDTLLGEGWIPIREIGLDGGGALLVLQKPADTAFADEKNSRSE